MKKGFTLIELLVVIALLALFIVILVPTGMNASKKAKQKMLDTKIESIESAAVVWGQGNKKDIPKIDDTTTCKIDEIKNDSEVTHCVRKSISDLIDNGIIKADEDMVIDGVNKKVLINPVTNEPLKDTCALEIYVKNKRVHAKYDFSNINECYYVKKDENVTGSTSVAGENTTTVAAEEKIYLTKLYDVILNTKDKNTSTITVPGQENSLSEEHLLYEQWDIDYNNYNYAYRGNVDYNYVTYSNMCWRIYGITSQGNIKLVLANENGKCSDSNTISGLINDGGFYWFSENDYVSNFSQGKLPNILNDWARNKNLLFTDNGIEVGNIKMVKGSYCQDLTDAGTSTVDDYIQYSKGNHFQYYGPKSRLFPAERATPTLSCVDYNTPQYTDYVGMLTADEVAIASPNGWLSDEADNYWTLSHYATWGYSSEEVSYAASLIFFVNYDGILDVSLPNQNGTEGFESGVSVRPVIMLSSDTYIYYGENGSLKNPADGTKTNPYVVVDELGFGCGSNCIEFVD